MQRVHIDAVCVLIDFVPQVIDTIFDDGIAYMIEICKLCTHIIKQVRIVSCILQLLKKTRDKVSMRDYKFCAAFVRVPFQKEILLVRDIIKTSKRILMFIAVQS